MIRVHLEAYPVVADRLLKDQLDLEVARLVLKKINLTHDMDWKKRYKTSLTSW
jgi:hypothetical protein